MTKKCTICLEIKSATDFNKNKSKKDGLNSLCKECSRIRSKQYYAENKTIHVKNVGMRCRHQRYKNREFVLEYLKTHPCVVCNETDPVVLEFNHLRDKKENISRMWAQGFALSSIKKEIEKCEVLCANCHRRKTAKDFGWYKCKS